MSTILNTQNLQENEQSIHYVPAEIQYDGEAKVSSYFESTMRKQPAELSASLRGRPLVGKTFEVPTGYTGIVVKETRKPFTEDEERNLSATQSFKSFNFWNLDLTPSEDDKISQAIKWIEVAKALHQPVSLVNDSQGSLKSEVSM